MNRPLAHPRLLGAALDDYAWLVAAGLLEDCNESCRSFLEGYLHAEKLFAARRWRRRAPRRAARTGDELHMLRGPIEDALRRRTRGGSERP